MHVARIILLCESERETGREGVLWVGAEWAER